MEVNSHIIKVCLMKYYRFKRQFLCVDEIGYEPADVLVDTGKAIIEIEIKISKQDLWKGEERKRKHKIEDSKRGCNQFYLCVPTELVEEGAKWIKETNQKYGLIEFKTELLQNGYNGNSNYLRSLVRAVPLNNNYKKDLNGRLSMRLYSALINSYENLIK